MANYVNHPRQRKRTDEYFKLGQDVLKPLYRLQISTVININSSSQKLTATRTCDSLMIHLGETHGYHIHFDTTQVTYGLRHWYLCPCCNSRCGILYLKKYFACRLCVKPAYRSQNGSKMDARMERIRSKRQKLWPNLPSWWRNDLLESSKYWPKPKGRHTQRFKQDTEQLSYLEAIHLKDIHSRINQ